MSDPRAPEVTHSFFEAIEAGDLPTVRACLDRDPSLANATDDRTRPWSYGSWEEYAKRVGAGIVDKEPEPRLRPPSEETALQVAVNHNQLEIVRLLVTHGADVNASDGSKRASGRRPLECAFRWDRDPLPFLELFLQHGLDVNVAARDQGRTYLDLAVLHLGNAADYVTVVETLLRHGANPNPVRARPERDADPPIYMAALQCCTHVVRTLIAAGADPNAPSRWKSALHAAACHGSDKIVEMLLAAGADPQAVDKDGKTALAARGETGCFYAAAKFA